MNPNDENEISEVKKRILAREKVQQEMDDLRAKIKELRNEQLQGKSVHKDIEAYLDYLKVLKKEKDSIREGNHTTFLDAKKLLSPKLNYGSKKEEVLAKIKELTKEIRATEKSLAGGGYDTNQRSELDEHLIALKEKHQGAMMELKSIEQFNHTRFMEQKELEKIALQTQENESTLPPIPIKGLKEPNKAPLPPKNDESSIDFNPPPMI